MQESLFNRKAVTKTQRDFCVFYLCHVFRQSPLPPGYLDTSLEGEMPASFSSSGNAFKYSQTLQAKWLNLSVDGVFRGENTTLVCVAVGWQWNMSLIGSPDSCLTSTCSRTGPSHSDTLIYTQMLIAMHSCPDQFDLYSGDPLF